jgi:hypothetical protein
MRKDGPPTAKDMKFGCTMLFPKKETVAMLKAAKHPAATWLDENGVAGLWAEVQAVARGNFGPDVDMTTIKLVKIHDGDKPRQQTGKVDENARGYVWAKTSSRDKPQLFRADKTPITDASELYAGCWVRAVLTVAPFLLPEHGVTLYLAGIQKLADDQAFSGRPRCEDEFDAVAQEGISNQFMAPPVAGQAAVKQPWEA